MAKQVFTMIETKFTGGPKDVSITTSYHGPVTGWITQTHGRVQTPGIAGRTWETKSASQAAKNHKDVTDLVLGFNLTY